jgi:hypothetical protein
MRAHDLVEPELAVEDETFFVALRHQSVFSGEDQRWIAAYDSFDLEKDEEKVMLLGRKGEPLSVNDIMGALDLVDTEDYRHLIERLQRKGLIRGVQRRRETGEKKRHLPRWTVVSPADADRYLGDLLKEVHRYVVDKRVDRLDRKDFAKISESISASSPYLKGDLYWSCRELSLVDQSGQPVGRLAALVESMGSGAELTKSDSDARSGRIAAKAARRSTTADAEDPLDVGDESEELSTTSLFIDNLDFRAVEQDVATFFSPIGGVTGIAVPPDFGRGDRNRGYAFVELDTKERAVQAIAELDGVDMKGRKTRVKWSRRSAR